MKVVSKTVWIVVLVFVAMTILSIIIGAVNTMSEKKSDTAINTEEYRESFMEGCMIDEKFKDFCTCGFNRIVSETSDDEFVALITDFANDPSDKSKLIIADVTQYCLDKIK